MTFARTPWRLSAGIAAAALVASSGILLAPTAAVAAEPTFISFVGESTVEAAFASDWNLTAAVTVQYGESAPRRLSTTDGTVDVYVSGVGGAFATALPIQPDGLVYIAQPLAKPLLASGTYQVTAIFNPAPGSSLATSQTPTPAALTITPLAIQPRITVTNDATVSEHPVISGSLAGEYVESAGGAPAGTWAFTVTDADGAEVFTTSVAQELGSTEPVRVEVTSKLASGSTFTVTGSFTPVSDLANGITVSEPPSESFDTPGTTLLDSLSTRIPFPWYLVLALGILLAGLVTTVVVLAVKVSRRPGSRGDASPARIPGEPQNVDVLSWDEAGLRHIDEPGLPASTNWALSDAGEVTERLETAQSKGKTDPDDSEGAAAESMSTADVPPTAPVTAKAKRTRAPKVD